MGRGGLYQPEGWKEKLMNVQELSDLTADQVVDARGSACPGPLLEAKRGMAAIPVGGIMEVLTSDEGTADDIPMWANKVGHEYLGVLEDAGYWRIFVRRGK